MNSQLIFADSTTFQTLFSMEYCKDTSISEIATQLALDATDRRRSLDSYTLLLTDAPLLAKIASSAAKLTFGRVVKLRPSESDLSARQKEVAKLVCAGLKNKDIAARLGVTKRTITFHVSSLLKQYGVKNRTELASLLSR
jgi:DNA-binding NarL/FixJ family response regulator